MRHFNRGLALTSLLVALTAFALSSVAAPPPTAGPPEHLFRSSVRLRAGFASVNSVAEARVDVNFRALERAGALRIRLLDGTQVVAVRTRLEERSASSERKAGPMPLICSRTALAPTTPFSLTASFSSKSGNSFIRRVQ